MVNKNKNFRDKLPSSKEMVTFSIFLFIAIGLWFASALGNFYEDEISVELEFYNYPKEKILYSVLPKKIDMLVSATGFTLMKHKFKSNLIIPIDLKKTIIKENNKYKISKVVFFNQIEKQLDRSVKINKIFYFDYDIDLSKVETKEVDVIPNIKLHLEDQYHLADEIKVFPSKVKIYGKKDVLDTIFFITTKALEISNLKTDLEENIELKRSKNYNIDINKVKLVIDVEQITEKSLKIPISVINLPDSLNMQLFPDRITVNFVVGFSKFDLIKADYFSAQINYSDINLNNKFANIRLIRYPKEINNVRFTPKKAEYLINLTK
jgi:hypothetical protein